MKTKKLTAKNIHKYAGWKVKSPDVSGYVVGISREDEDCLLIGHNDPNGEGWLLDSNWVLDDIEQTFEPYFSRFKYGWFAHCVDTRLLGPPEPVDQNDLRDRLREAVRQYELEFGKITAKELKAVRREWRA